MKSNKGPSNSNVKKDDTQKKEKSQHSNKVDNRNKTSDNSTTRNKGQQQNQKAKNETKQQSKPRQQQQPNHKPTILPNISLDDPNIKHRVEKKKIISHKPSPKQLPLFSHLPQYQRIKNGILECIVKPELDIHPAIYNLGLQYASHKITGANERCLAMVQALKKFFKDYEPESEDVYIAMDITQKLNPLIEFLDNCRPKSIGMGNFIRYYLKPTIELTHSKSFKEGKEMIINEINQFIAIKIKKADEEIANYGCEKIYDGDVILTYARSMVVKNTLIQAHKVQGKKFKVIVVDSRPRFEGKRLLKELVEEGIECEYVMLNSISYLMKEAKKVMIGAHSILSNGQVYSRVGTSLVCMMAKTYHVPVIVLCEAYKFSERVQLDSICQNELDDPDDLNVINPSGKNELEGWKNRDHLKLLNLVYDLTPTEFIDMVITEMGMVPPTSAPVVVRHSIGNFQ